MTGWCHRTVGKARNHCTGHFRERALSNLATAAEEVVWGSLRGVDPYHGGAYWAPASPNSDEYAAPSQCDVLTETTWQANGPAWLEGERVPGTRA